jgi:hypothetical protein
VQLKLERLTLHTWPEHSEMTGECVSTGTPPDTDAVQDLPVHAPAGRRKSVRFELPPSQPSLLEVLKADESDSATRDSMSSDGEHVDMFMVHTCPSCRIATTGYLPARLAAGGFGGGTCDNRSWGWNGEPHFCCLCAWTRGLGKLSHLGCDTCKARRSRFYKKTGWFNDTCQHCKLPSAEHKGSKERKERYPRCPVAAPCKIILETAVKTATTCQS